MCNENVFIRISSAQINKKSTASQAFAVCLHSSRRVCFDLRGGVELSIHALFEEIGMDKLQIKNRKWKVFTVMLNSFQHLTSFVCSLLACKLLKQVQDDQKCVIACNDGNNFSPSTKNSHPIQGRSKTWTYCIKFERQVEKCLA